MTRYRPEIDGLRGLAVVAVILNHLHASLLPNGFLGVDIFFVISGYVITASLMGSGETLSELLLKFYSKRMKRLLPALVFCVLVTAFAYSLFNPNPENTLKTGIAALFGLSNFYLLFNNADYFAQSTVVNAFTQTWSLGVEEQFYLFFPFLIFITGFGVSGAKGRNKLIGLVSFFSFFSIAIFLFYSQRYQPYAFYLMPSRFWEIGLGSLLLLLSRDKSIDGSLVTYLNSFALIAMFLVFGFTSFQFLDTILIVFSTLVILATFRADTLAFRLLSHPVCVYLGKISYSLYLWHWSVVCIAHWTIRVTPATIPILLFLMLALSVFSYHCVESPLRIKKWTDSDFQTLGLGFGVVLIGSTLLFGLTQTNFFSLDRLNPSLLYKGLEKQKGWVGRTGLRKKAAKADQKKCQVSTHSTMANLRRCLLPERSVRNLHAGRLLIIGDSHARQYVRQLRAALPEHEVLYFTAGSGCGYLPKRAVPFSVASQTNCSEHNSLVTHFLREDLTPDDTVLLANMREAHTNLDELRESLEFVAQIVSKNDARLILLDDPQGLRVEEPIFCDRKPWRPTLDESCFTPLDLVMKQQSRADAIREEIAKKYHGVSSLVLRSHYCEKNEICGPTLDGLTVYSDQTHLTQGASAIGAKLIAQEFINSYQ